MLKSSGNITKTKGSITQKEIDNQKIASKLELAPRIYTFGPGFIEMEYIKGQTMDDYLRTNINRNIFKHKLKIAITKLYDGGIKHNDLTGKNIIITPEGVVKIIDYEHSVLYDGPVPKNERNFGITKNF